MNEIEKVVLFMHVNLLYGFEFYEWQLRGDNNYQILNVFNSIDARVGFQQYWTRDRTIRCHLQIKLRWSRCLLTIYILEVGTSSLAFSVGSGAPRMSCPDRPSRALHEVHVPMF